VEANVNAELQLVVGHPAVNFLEGGLQFQSRQVRTKASVHACAESHVSLNRPLENDRIRVVELGGVAISVRPEVLVAGPEAGAVKFYLSKTNPLTKDERGRLGSAGFAAAALHLWADEAFGGAAPERCLVVDVFAGEVYEAPVRNATRRRHMLAACEEIAAVWPSLSSPPTARPSASRSSP